MRYLLFILGFVLNFSLAGASPFTWIGGGSFYDISPAGTEDVWFGGEIIVHGKKNSSGKWEFIQAGKEITKDGAVVGISFLNAMYGMVITDNYVYYTSDGGSGWIKNNLPGNYTFYDIQMTGEKEAFICGKEKVHYGQGVIAKTTDGGTTWKIIFKTNIYYGGSFYQLKMWDNNKGVAVGTFYDGWGKFGALFSTEDGWNTGYKSVEKGAIGLYGISSPQQDVIFFYGGDIASNPYLGFRNRIYTKDIELPSDVAKIGGICFYNATYGLVVGHYEDQQMYERGGVLLETRDGGETWTRINFPDYTSLSQPQDSYLLNIEIFNLITKVGDDLFIGQKHSDVYPCADRTCTGKILHSVNGRDWEIVDKLSGFSYKKVYVFDNNEQELKAYFIGYDGSNINSFFRKLEDNTLMVPHYFDYLCTLYDLEMFDVVRGVSAYCRDDSYQKFYLLYTDNGGSSWQKREIENFNDNFIDNIDIASSEDGNIILGIKSGQYNYILKNLFSYPQRIDVFGITSLNYLSNGTACFLENFVPLCINEQNEKTYLKIGDDQFANFIYLKFINDSVAFAIRKHDKVIYKSEDGGNSWTLTGMLPIFRDDIKVAFFDEHHGYLIYGDKIEYTNDSGTTWTELPHDTSPSSISSISFGNNLGAVLYTPSGMVLKKTSGEVDYTKDYCSRFNDISYDLYVPCLFVGGVGYTAIFNLAVTSPYISIVLDNFVGPANFVGQNGCASFEPATNTLHLPCVYIGEAKYSLDFVVRDLTPRVELELVNMSNAN